MLSLWRLLAVWGLLALALDTFAQTNSGPDALLLTAEGRVEWQAVGQSTWASVQSNQVFRAREKVRTGLKSRATLRLANQTVVRMNQLTTVEIQPQSEENRRTLIDFREGAAFFYNREGAGNSFRTPTASGAIRGTEFHLAVDAGGNTVVTMLDGEVDLENELGMVHVMSGEQGIVERGQAPRKTAVIDAVNIVQWALYYPAIIDPDELQLAGADKDALARSLDAYRQGNLVPAAQWVPEGFQATSEPARLYHAGTLLFSGQVDEATRLLAGTLPLANALREMIAAVKFSELAELPNPTSGSEWLARSYYLQSRGNLEEARDAARTATTQSPNFGFAWARLAELEFSFGQTPAALAAAERALERTPANAQALALQGFVLAAQYQRAEALEKFDCAIALDPALGNAWLGRGLLRIRQGQIEAGRQDLQTALTLEPNRAIMRSYVGKAHHQEGNERLARKEFDLAKRLDPNDPTSFLYSALLNQQGNRLNQAVRDLETSQDLNDNRSVYRSRLLLDQDRAVRSANLASIYRDNGMIETSFREASRAVNFDYANYSAHLFLANSYDALRDPRQVNLRYETPWLSELFLANLLQPVGGGSLSQNVSQQEYSRFFEGNRLGLISLTEYFSNGDWFQRASQYGHYNQTAYSIDLDYHSINGWRPNNDSEALTTHFKVKHQITPRDSILLHGIYYDFEGGDLAQYYDQSTASRTQRVKENQEPLLFVGYNREWSPGNNTLLLFGRFDDTFTRTDPGGQVAKIIRSPVVPIGTPRFSTNPAEIDYRSELTGYSFDAQHIWDVTKHSVVAGGRFQTAELDIDYTSRADQSQVTRPPEITTGSLSSDIERYSLYIYDHWQVFEPLTIIAGLSYDRLHYPANTDVVPVVDEELTREQISPKAGFIYRPWTNGFFRGAYTRSLGGVFFDNSIRLEPVQIAGFTQLYRSIIPESALGAGVLPGARFTTYGLGFDQRLGKGTYIGLDAEMLEATGDLTLGAHEFTGFGVSRISTLVNKLDYQEKTLYANVSQLLSDEWSVGARYRLTWAHLEHRYDEARIPQLDSHDEATLHQVNLYAIYNLPCGFFSQFHAIWSQQSNQESLSGLPGDDFWHFNVFAGYRFLQRRAELRVGLLNITDQDYQLHPITLYSELPRERTFYASLKLNF